MEKASHAQIRALYRELLALRRREQALRPGAPTVHASADAETSTIQLRAKGEDGSQMVSVFNLSDEQQTISLPDSDGAEWEPVFTSDDLRFGGKTETSRLDATAVAPWSASAWRRREASTQ
jgi:hypothetical protein